MVNLYLVRHGETVTNTQRLVCGQTDTPLTARGEEQARALGDFLGGIAFAHRYTSSLQRARRTAELAVGLTGFTEVPELKEMNTGDHSALTVDELYRIDGGYRYQGRNARLRYPQGECFEELYARITKWYDTESARWADGANVLVVGHEATVSCLLHHIFKIPADSYPTFQIRNAEGVRVELDRENQQYRMQFMNGGRSA